ncbi:MAG TPA: alkaline phosphatase family protein, partial [Nevskiaceae bacterium]|nr:alkaline phosphatase family protein [Nevskiaceae bacterium]
MFHPSALLRAAAVAALALLGSCNNDSGSSGTVSGPVRHFFVIVLENKGYSTTFESSPAPSSYLAQTLPSMGVLLRQYYGTGHASLDNYITMISGQPPNALTQADCPLFVNVTPGTLDPLEQNAIYIGQGCVFPASTQTIVDELEALGFSWKGYMQDLDDGTTHTCRHPALNSQDTTENATAANQYATRHNPFMYFHSIIDQQARCDAHVVDLAVLNQDLQSAATTPNYTFITPDLCADGH